MIQLNAKIPLQNEPPDVTLRSPAFVIGLVAAALFMELLDSTIIATALPQMARTFHVGAVNLNIGMTAYMLTLGVFIPISGWMADHAGSRTVFAAAIALFTVASVFCGFSQNVLEFTASRILQGMGGAMMVPVGRLIVLRSTPRHELTQALAHITWPALSAPIIGPPLGGLITTYASWRWIFFLNVPLGLVALTLTFASARSRNVPAGLCTWYRSPASPGQGASYPPTWKSLYTACVRLPTCPWRLGLASPPRSRPWRSARWPTA